MLGDSLVCVSIYVHIWKFSARKFIVTIIVWVVDRSSGASASTKGKLHESVTTVPSI